MPQAFSATVIYSALLSSGNSTGSCTSSRSTVRVIVKCMRGAHRSHAFSDVPHRSTCRHHASAQGHFGDTKSEQARSLLAPGETLPRRGDVKNLRTFARRHQGFPRQPRVPIFDNKYYLSQSPLLRLANPRSLPIYHYPVQSIHSSTNPATIEPNDARKSPPETNLARSQISALTRFRLCTTGLATGHGDLESAWASFEALRTSDDLSKLSHGKLMRFTVPAYEASRLSLHDPKALSREDAVRLGRLHDELQRRVEGSVDIVKSTLQTWSNTLAVQTLILAGKLDKASQMLTETLVNSKGQASPQQIILLLQLFLASTRQCSLEAGLAVLAKTWFWIRNYFHMHPPGQEGDIKTAAEDLRQAVVFTFGIVDEAGAFLQTIEDRAVQEVGTSIFAFVYGMQQSPEKNRAVYRDFVSRGLSIPLEAYLRFFTALLSKEAYIPAYAMRKHIHSQFPGQQAEQEIVAALRSFPALATPGPAGQDALSLKAVSAAIARFSSCINGPPLPRPDVLSIWEDVEASDILSRDNGRSSLYVNDASVLAFAQAIVECSRATLGERQIPNAKAFAHILDQLVGQLTRRFFERYGQDVENPFTVPLRWHSLTLKGDLVTVGDLLVKDRRRQRYPLHVRAMTQLFLVASQLQSLREAFLYLVPLWPVVVQHLDDASTRYRGEMGRESTQLRKSIFTVFGNIEDPGAWIAGVTGTPEAQDVAGHLFFTLFREQRDSTRALQLLDDLQARGLSVSYQAHLVLLKMFLREREYEVASRVYRSLQSRYPERTQTPELREKDELHTALRLFSLQGNLKQAQECFDVLQSRGLVDGGARRRLLHAYAEGGDTERVHELFHQFFSLESRSLPRPCDRDYREVIYAHVRAGDLVGINHWLDEMVKANVLPDLSIYNMILLAFANFADLESASAVLARMYENDVKPDRISYTTVISIMADRKDPISAEQLYQRALEDGVEPDDVMTMALMNAHVEAGSWRGVIRAFDYLRQSGGQSKRHTTQLYNTLLKAYVLIGAPFRVVSDIFWRFESLALEPTEYSYALLIQSACDSGRMDIASDIFIQLDATVLHGQTNSPVNAYVMTIIMAGFLRTGNKERAKAVYDDMHGRGIQPTSVTFGVIVQSYANERSEESLRIAEDFMHSLLSTEESQRAWIGSTRGGRPKALESVFGPLMSISGRQLDVAAVERQFDEMLAAGGQPTLVALTMLMDAYRRVGNIEGAQQIWHEIVAVALRISQSDVFARLPLPSRPHPRPRGGPQRQANILCLSLSVYIDALSAAGRHVEIATTWRQVRDWGFAFDAHNWNHLAVALVRAGEVERAFEIVERVLVPYQVQTRNFVRARRKDPETPLTFVCPAADVDAEGAADAGASPPPPADDEAARSPARPPHRRVHAVRSATRLQGGLSALDDAASDPAQPLHELQQLSLTWQAWRTHNATLDVLATAMQQLAAGVRVRATGQALRADEDPRRMGPGEATEFYARERRAAAEVLQRIYENYQKAVGLVEQRERVLHSLSAEAAATMYR